MQFFLYFLFFLSSVRCALVTITSQANNLVWESDVSTEHSSQTYMAGEPYLVYSSPQGMVSASSVVNSSPQSRVSASSVVNSSPQSRISASSVLSAVTTVGTVTQTSTNPSDGSKVLTGVQSTYTVSSFDLPVDSSKRVTTLLTKSSSTTTSTLFSTSLPVQSAQVNGTRLTSISSESLNPLVTQKPSSSMQTTVINPVTLSSNKTVSISKTTSLSVSQIWNSSYIDTYSSGSTATGSNAIYTKSSISSNMTSWSTSSQILSSIKSSSPVIESSSTIISITSPSTSSSQTTSAIQSSSAPSSSISSSSSSDTPVVQSKATVDIFQAISTDLPPLVFPRAANPMSIASGVSNDGPIQTNKFYTNLMVGSQSSSAFVYPYSLWKYSSGQNLGLVVQHTSSNQYSFGNYDSNGNSEFLVNPLGINELFFSSTNFNSGAMMNLDTMTPSSTNVKLVQGSESADYVEIPLVQGMGFATAIYHGSLIAKLGSGVGIKVFSQVNSEFLADGIIKYRIELLSGVTWLCYVTIPDNVSKSSFSLNAQNAYSIVANTAIDGLIIQTSVAPENANLEVFYDQAAGMYVTDMQLTGTSDGKTANYGFTYTTKGKSLSGNSIIFALPHHESSLVPAMANSYTGICMQSTTKGVMKGYLSTYLKFSQELNKQLSWLPWSPQLGSAELKFSSEQLKLLAEVANAELQVSISASISGLNTYYIGKVIDKYAYILLTVSQIIGDEDVTRSTLTNLKTAFDILINNKQFYPLIYDTKFNGLVSSGDWGSTSTGYDFGNTYYNDHHFHYGYIIHAAAVVGYVDQQLGGNWAEENKDWVNTLVRDVANPSQEDTYFATSRMFDWYHGHSWAAGLFENGNGKNQESSSEDYNFAYGMKLWGSVIEDQSMELRGDLMISVMSDSMAEYYLYEDSNTVEPSKIIGNKVCGILFDNIIDYTTYFGTNVEYKHGIHMLPITPVSGQIRQPQFVKEEWEEKISPIVSSLNNGWSGILRLNEALYDPASSYAFFSDKNFNSGLLLDNGMSRTWALAFSGGLANSMGLL